MKATKAYLAGLGTTGILIGSAVVVLVLGSGAAAFNGLPGFGAYGALDRVIVEDDPLAADEREARGADTARRAGERAGRDALAQRVAPAGLPGREGQAPGARVRDVDGGDRKGPRGGGNGSGGGGLPGGGVPGGGGGVPGGGVPGGGLPGGGVPPRGPIAPPAIPPAPSVSGGLDPVLPPTSRAAPRTGG